MSPMRGIARRISARRNALVRRFSRIGMRLLRRWGLLPLGLADRNGDDDRLAGRSLAQTVMVYFPGTQEDIYQLRQWYGPLRTLDERYPLIVVLQDSRTARIVRDESGLLAITIARYGRLDDLLSRSQVKLALYVNHSPQNFAALRFMSLAHVYLSHGDSDKGVSVSNQVKAYDFLFVAGQAAVDRIQNYTMLYDAAKHCLLIGRPQLDDERASEGSSGPSARTASQRLPTVLYAPTWEGAQPSLAYGSVVSHGPPLMRALLADGRFAVVYRPHPLNVVTSAEYSAADGEVRRLVAEAAAEKPASGHRIETDLSVSESFAGADLLVCDVSAMAMSWLPSGKPMVITEPDSSVVVTARTRMLDVVPRLSVTDLPGVVELIADQLDRDPTRAARAALVDYYLGDITQGAATKRFLDACAQVIAIRDEAWGAVRARGPAGP
jgi:hypothetical protein